jgi:nucleoid-associated protein YgaU
MSGGMTAGSHPPSAWNTDQGRQAWARIDNERTSSEDVPKEDDGMKRTLTCAVALAAGAMLFLAPGSARCADQTIEHTIQSGDNLHLIAGYYYGDPRQWKRIWRANRKAIAGASLLVPGRVLRIADAHDDNPFGSYEDFRSRVRGK